MCKIHCCDIVHLPLYQTVIEILHTDHPIVIKIPYSDALPAPSDASLGPLTSGKAA